MENPKKISFFAKRQSVIILIVTTLVCVLLALSKITRKLDYRIYDLLLGWTKAPEASEQILLVDIGDKSLNEYGSWPWTRDILGDVLLRMKDLGAKTAVFDIEYLSDSSLTVDEGINDITQSAFTNGEETIAGAISSFADTIAEGYIPLSEVQEASSELINNTVDPTLSDMFMQISSGLNKDNDDYFARTLQFFGNSSLTINTRDVKIDVSPEDESYAEKRFLFTNVTDPAGLIERDNNFNAAEDADNISRDFVPAIHKIISSAKGAGFTNVVVDTDGTRRRVELLNQHNGRYTGQLSFSPIVRMLDVTEIIRKPRSIILKDALLPGSEKREDIKIPLDDHGRMLVNWLHQIYADSFRHTEVFNFKYLDDDEDSIYYDLCCILLADNSELSDDDRDFISNAEELVDFYDEILSKKDSMLSACLGYDEDGNAIGGGLSDNDYEEYFGMRKEYFESCTNFAESLSTLSIPEGDLLTHIQEFISDVALYNENYKLMHDFVNGTFCIIGNSATGSTDLGVMPFQRRYANLGTHANVANTILQKDFIRYVDVWFGIAFAFIAALIVMLFTQKLSPAKRSVWNLLFVLIPNAVLILMMVLFRIYTPLTVPLILLIITYLIELAMSFIVTEKDKNTLRRGFDSYVAPEVVSEIVKNPNLLGLGGVSKHITALFSDVKTFSGFTETVNNMTTDEVRKRNEQIKSGEISGKELSEEEIIEEGAANGASRLVSYLNDYLGALSDAIMLEHGTIDKYVGDEIVSFFGAPIDDPNHAWNACVAGIRMLQAESKFNEEYGSSLPINPRTGKPFYLRSRVGINTGDMTVGNMGTSKKLNYTIMGNNVNLASRLEGTNKAYDSWIMCSESTWKEANSGEHEGKLVSKMLDCVKVVNVEKPVQIYSIQGLRSEMKSEEIEASAIFNKGMEFYLNGRDDASGEKDIQDFYKAIHYFEDAARCYESLDYPDKGSLSMEQKMIERCRAFIQNGLPKDSDGKILPWTGVYTMTSK
ncbi:MAG: CHASE2 domain-containing protein [Treponema sp.]|nr:CHASE2 domain-containing protein [Treponema sp.]